MRFDATELDGAWLIGLEPAGDHRGFFARTSARANSLYVA